jgi:hypothetical protein
MIEELALPERRSQARSPKDRLCGPLLEAADEAWLIFNRDGPSVGRKSLILLERAGDFVKM